MFIIDDIIAQKIVEKLGEWARKKLERNHRVHKLLQVFHIGALKEEFESIYAYAMVEFAVEAEPVELVLLFAAKPVKAAFKEMQVQGVQRGPGPGTWPEALEHELRTNKKLALLTHIYKSHLDLGKEMDRFREAFEYFTLQTGSPLLLRKYNEDKKFQAEVLAEKERRSFDFQVENYMQRLEAEFRRDYLDNNYYIDLNGEVRLRIKSGVGIRPQTGEEMEEPGGAVASPVRGPGETGAEKPYETVTYKPLDQYIYKWLADDKANLLVLLGEYGTGKTTFLRHMAHQLAVSRQEPDGVYAARDTRQRIPLFFPLRDFEKNIDSFIVNCFNREGITDIDFAAFKRRQDNAELVLMLDGFDEMTQKIDADEKGKNFDKIRTLLEASANNKVILSVRQEYFKSAADFQEVFKAEGKGNYWFVYLLPFDDVQIKQYLQSHTGDPEYYWQQIKTIFDLHDLAKRPVLLQLIVDHLPGLIAAKGAKESINASDLYRQCIEDELRRKSNLDFMVPGKYRLDILQKLAVRMFLQDELSFDTGLLEGELNLKQYFKTERAWEFEKYLNEFLTFTFLLREGDNRYRISHKSFRDYLTAAAFVKEIKAGKIENFGRKRITKEINHFILEQGAGEEALLQLVMTARDLPEERQWQGANGATLLLKLNKKVLKGRDLSGCRLTGVDFKGCDLEGTDFTRADLSYCEFDKTVLNAKIRETYVDTVQLYLGNSKLENLEFFKLLKGMSVLSLRGNELTDLSPLRELKKLTYLNISDNQLTDLSPLQELKILKELYLCENQIINLTPLRKLKNLNFLDLSNNQITDLSPLQELKNLNFLNLSNNQITDLSSLRELKSLTDLRISNNQITDLSPLHELEKLTELYLYNNQITNLSPLRELKNLYYLYLNNNQITDLSPLWELKNLKELYISKNPADQKQLVLLKKRLPELKIY